MFDVDGHNLVACTGVAVCGCATPCSRGDSLTCFKIRQLADVSH